MHPPTTPYWNYPTVELTNSDFANGTLRIQKPGIYRLTEDIVFAPNPDNQFLPYKKDMGPTGKYPGSPGPYSLGFFAAITMESDYIYLDLNGHRIEQSHEFYARQRFFNLISVSSSPFIPGQGPGAFGQAFKAARYSTISNGTLGLTSHSGIHGNGAKCMIIENLHHEDFEVGGITLNGVQNIQIRNIKIEHSMGSRLKVPFNGRFSSAVFLVKQLKCLEEDYPEEYRNFVQKVGAYRLPLSKLKQDLEMMVERSIQRSIKNGLETELVLNRPEKDFFANPGGLPDGSAIYGILINCLGIAVNEFGACLQNQSGHNKDGSNNIHIENVNIQDMVLKPREVVGLLGKDNSVIQTDFSGSVMMVSGLPWYENRFQPDRTFVDSDGKFDIQTATQVALFQFSTQHPASAHISKGAAKISPAIIDWVEKGTTSFPLDRTVRNIDIMAHIMKGVVGIRLENTKSLRLQKIHLSNLHNMGNPGIQGGVLQGYLDGTSASSTNKHGGHPKSNDMEIGYTANETRGISLVGVTNLETDGIILDHVFSQNGSVYGVDVMHTNECIRLQKLAIQKIHAGDPKRAIPYGKPHDLPYTIQKAIAVYVRYNNTAIHLGKLHAKKIWSSGFSASLVNQADSDIHALDVLDQDTRLPKTFEINAQGDTDEAYEN